MAEKAKKELSLVRLQVELSAWQDYCFPDATHEDCLFGVVEEVGEAAHAHLKGKQGIRGSREAMEEKGKDAAADALIFLLQYCSKKGWNLMELVTEVWETDVSHRDWRVNPESGGDSPQLQRLLAELRANLDCIEDPEAYAAGWRTHTDPMSCQCRGCAAWRSRGCIQQELGD